MVDTASPPESTRIQEMSARALLLGTRLDTRGFEGDTAIAVTPLTLRLAGGGTALLFRYGVVVLIGATPAAEEALLSQLAPRVGEPIATRETEHAIISIVPGREEQVDPSGNIVLQEPGPERLQVVASVLAKSVVLGYYEGRIASTFDLIEPLADALRRSGDVASSPRALLRQIGAVLRTQQLMVGRVELEDEPELLWIHPEFKRLYGRLAEEYELRERSRSIDRKLMLVQENVGTLLDLVQSKRSVRLEILVVALIGIEILLTCVDLALRFMGW